MYHCQYCGKEVTTTAHVCTNIKYSNSGGTNDRLAPLVEWDFSTIVN